MDIILEYLQHLDLHLIALVTKDPIWTYAILFGIFFSQTGIIPMAFLPGDSLLLALGVLAAKTPVFNAHLLFILLFIATVLGKTLNYFIGQWLGPKIFSSNKSLLFNLKHLRLAEKIYKKWGVSILILGCFIPVIRTFSPCIAGIAKMRFLPFCCYNIIGSLLWIGSLLYSGFLFGNIPFFKENFSLVLIGIIIFTILLRIFLSSIKLTKFNNWSRKQ